MAIYGPLPDLAVRQGLSDILKPKASARRDGTGMVMSVPVEAGRYCVWLLPEVPGMADLGPMLARAQAMSVGFLRLMPAAPEPETLHRLARRVLRPTRGPGAVVQVLGEVLVETRQARAICALDPGRRRIWVSDESLALQRDLLRTLMMSHARAGGTARLVRRDGDDPADLEARLALQAVEAETMWISGAEEAGRYVTLIIAPTLPLQSLALQADAVLQIASPIGATSPRKGWMKPARWAAALAVGIFLAWPVPTKITVTGAAIPAQMAIAALPSDATLVAMLVRVGDSVTAGQPVAEFRSTTLAEQQAQESLSIAMEELNAQAAIAKGDFGSFQIATQREDIAKARLAQIDARIGALVVLAPATGHVVQALPQNSSGAFHPAGRDVVGIQQGQDFLMTLTPSRVDARRITVGMKGDIYFRGLSQADYTIEILTPPVPHTPPDGGPEVMQVIGRVEGARTDLLLSGLAGYARLSGPDAPRIVGLSYYIVEYARVQGWKYLGLHI